MTSKNSLAITKFHLVKVRISIKYYIMCAVISHDRVNDEDKNDTFGDKVTA